MSYGVTNTAEKIKEFKPRTNVVKNEYELKTYDRWLRLGPVPAIHITFIILLLQAHTPVGVKITVKEHDIEDEKYR